MILWRQLSNLLPRIRGLLAQWEGKGFYNLIKILEPEYTMPAHEIIMYRLTVKYDRLNAKALVSMQCSVALCLTTGMWTSSQMEYCTFCQ